MFLYYKNLLTEEQIEESDLNEDDVPKLLFGTTGINSGFCIYTGSHFIWLNVITPEAAIEIANKIKAVEEN